MSDLPKRSDLFLKKQCERFDKLLSLDHSVARKASEEYDAAYHDAVHALYDLNWLARAMLRKHEAPPQV